MRFARYFVITGYDRKGGKRAEHATEYESHREATAAAALAVFWLEQFAGEEPGSQSQTFEVFVGSKASLDRRLRA